VWFTINGRPYQFELNRVYEINNQMQHSVANRGETDRITFIFDYVPPGPLVYAAPGGIQRPEQLSVELADTCFRVPPAVETSAAAGAH
jgi:hypothetical protein